MGFAARKARADDGRADDDLGTLLAIVDSSTGCRRVTSDKSTHGLLCKLGGRFRGKLVWSRVQTALRQRTLDHGGGGESEGEDALHSSGGKYTATQLSEQMSRGAGNSDTWRTTETSSI